jgi:hypothetical protein
MSERTTIKRVEFHRLCVFLEANKSRIEALPSTREVHELVEKETRINCALSAIIEACDGLNIFPIAQTECRMKERISTLEDQVSKLSIQIQNLDYAIETVKERVFREPEE